jgi:alcohol dehydrogenase
MKVFTIKNKYSKEDQLQLVEVPMPIAKENEVLIQIHSASVNQLDCQTKNGRI